MSAWRWEDRDPLCAWCESRAVCWNDSGTGSCGPHHENLVLGKNA